jgi:hypothetical protein
MFEPHAHIAWPACISEAFAGVDSQDSRIAYGAALGVEVMKRVLGSGAYVLTDPENRNAPVSWEELGRAARNEEFARSSEKRAAAELQAALFSFSGQWPAASGYGCY